MNVIALDVGGSSIKSGWIDSPGHLVNDVLHTPVDSTASADHIIERLYQVIREYRSQHQTVNEIGIAFPGPFDYQNGVSYIANLEKYGTLYNRNVRDALNAYDGLADMPIRFRNDAEAAIVGEALYGAARGSRRVLGVTLGTGFGSAFLIDGVPQTSGMGIPVNGWLYPELVADWAGGMTRANDRFSTRGLLKRFTKSGVSVNDVAQAAALARQGDPTLLMLFEEFGHRLGVFLAPFVEAFNADCVLVTGGIANAFDLFEHALIGGLRLSGKSASVRRGTLGAVAALFGAAVLI